jgi:hypothetical protein
MPTRASATTIESPRNGSRSSNSRSEVAEPRDEQSRQIRFSQISPQRQVLVRLCQLINFGEVRDLDVRNREPVLGSSVVVLADVRLDADEAMRCEARLSDFTLCQELRRLLAQLDGIEHGRITRIEIRAGLPRRMLFETQVQRLLG